ncbi:hypothetical protein BGZ94_001808 [Podila epigama]|nr:hypothetical protein BGZ94_001808 [Podila epigama]
MFNWIKSPQLPEKDEVQAFQSIAGGPIYKIGALKDRTNNLQLIPWEDLLEIFPNAVYVRDKDGIVTPARDIQFQRIVPRSIKLRADEVLQVVSSTDPPPKSAVSNMEPLKSTDTITDYPKGSLAGSSSSPPTFTSSIPSSITTPHTPPPNRGSSEGRRVSSSTGYRGSTDSGRRFSSHTQHTHAHHDTSSHQQHSDGAEDEWSDFQANNTPPLPGVPSLGASTATATTAEISTAAAVAAATTEMRMLRQDISHRFEMLNAEQEERFQLAMRACKRPEAHNAQRP